MAITTLLVLETSAARRIWFSNFSSSSIAASNLLSCGSTIKKSLEKHVERLSVGGHMKTPTSLTLSNNNILMQGKTTTKKS
jgi:hypothetical protein